MLFGELWEKGLCVGAEQRFVKKMQFYWEMFDYLPGRKILNGGFDGIMVFLTDIFILLFV